ncbi:MAG: hypothetical protein HRU20_28910 [Pseudomonadales bacterium]|nr:hypothetical protein [Pseudomonadales bacterium]
MKFLYYSFFLVLLLPCFAISSEDCRPITENLTIEEAMRNNIEVLSLETNIRKTCKALNIIAPKHYLGKNYAGSSVIINNKSMFIASFPLSTGKNFDGDYFSPFVFCSEGADELIIELLYGSECSNIINIILKTNNF